jgi:hypothetical protein
LGFEFTGDDDTSRMPGGEMDDDDIIERLTRIFKDMPGVPCPGVLRRSPAEGGE